MECGAEWLFAVRHGRVDMGYQKYSGIVEDRTVKVLRRFVSGVMNLFRHPLSGTILACCIIISSQYYPMWMIAGMALAIYISIRLLMDVWAGRRKEYRRVKVLLLVASFMGYLAVPMELAYHWQEVLAVKMYPGKFALCKAKGVAFGARGDQILSVCYVNKKWWRDGRMVAIVYDSSGQIEWRKDRRSVEWKNAALSLDKVVPFGIIGFTVQSLTDRLYVVDFNDDLTQNVITEE